jgi:hypothetical protein
MYIKPLNIETFKYEKSYDFNTYNIYSNISITCEGGGGQNWPWVLGILFYKGSNLKDEKIGPIKRKFFIFFSLSTFYFPLFNSVAI